MTINVFPTPFSNTISLVGKKRKKPLFSFNHINMSIKNKNNISLFGSPVYGDVNYINVLSSEDSISKFSNMPLSERQGRLQQQVQRLQDITNKHGVSFIPDVGWELAACVDQVSCFFSFSFACVFSFACFS